MKTAAGIEFSGVAVTTATPFLQDGSLDLASLARQVDHLGAGGVRLVIPAGNTGEFFNLDVDEIKRVTRATVEAASESVAVMGGVGGSLPIAIDLARAAQDDGADAIMIHSPGHTYSSRQAIADYMLQIVDAVDLPVSLYKRGDALPDSVIVELSKHERVAAVKYAVNDLPAFERVLHAADAAVYCGTAELWAPFFAIAGAAGFTSGVANVTPALTMELNQRLVNHDYAGAMEIRATLAPFEEARARKFAANNVTVVKYGLWKLGLDSGVVRAPLTSLDAEDRAFVDSTLEGWARDGHVTLVN